MELVDGFQLLNEGNSQDVQLVDLLRSRESVVVIHDLRDRQHLQPLLSLDLWRLQVVVEVDPQAILPPILLFLQGNLLGSQSIALVDVESTFDGVLELLKLIRLSKLQIGYVDSFQVEVKTHVLFEALGAKQPLSLGVQLANVLRRQVFFGDNS